jgi:hypothetical protein
MASTLDILKRLNNQNVKYVLVGGMACVVHGSQVVTQDVDICAPFTAENLKGLCAALADIHPRFRMARDLQPMPQTLDTLTAFKNLYLITDLGQLDILSEITGVGKYSDLEQHTIAVDLRGISVRVLDIDTLILAKKAMNAPKDRQVVIELAAIRERMDELKIT